MARVLVHSCFDSETENFDPTACYCKRFVRNTTRDRMIADGEAFNLMLPNAANELVADRHQIVVRPKVKKPKVPKAATITEKHIAHAYVEGNRFEQTRIDAYGAASRRGPRTDLYAN